MRGPSGEPELVRAAAAGDPAAARGVVGRLRRARLRLLPSDPGATPSRGRRGPGRVPARPSSSGAARTGESFGVAVFRAARTTSYELLGRAAGPRASGRGGRACRRAAARLRPQQRAALALDRPRAAALRRDRGRAGHRRRAPSARCWRVRGCALHDELHGTALAAAAVRSPDCEEVLAAAGARRPTASWGPPTRAGPIRTSGAARRARARAARMEEAAATYAAWSPAVRTPIWLRAATLAELGRGGAAAVRPRRRRPPRRRHGPASRPAVLGAALLAVAFAALALSAAATLRQGDPATRGTGCADATRSLQVAGAPTPRRGAPAGQEASGAPVRRARARRPAARAGSSSCPCAR